VTGNLLLDRLYSVSRTELRSVVSRSGRMDAGTWMYNMEWLGTMQWLRRRFSAPGSRMRRACS